MTKATGAVTHDPHHSQQLLIHVTLFWGAYLGVLWGTSFLKAKIPPLWGSLVWGLTSSVTILAMTLLFLRREKRAARDVGLDLKPGSFLRFLVGIAAGVAVFGLQILVVSLVAGPIHLKWAGTPQPTVVTAAVLGTTALASMEEVGFRGYPLRTLVPIIGLWPSQGIVALAFGLCHSAFGWSWPAIVLGVIPAALLFGMAAITSRDLATPIGLHTGLNLAQSSLSQNSNWGFCALVFDDNVHDKVATIAPFSGAIIVIMVALAFWAVSKLAKH